MLQIVHDVAPGASLAFYTAENGEADFANGIVALAKAPVASGRRRQESSPTMSATSMNRSFRTVSWRRRSTR